MFPTKPYASAQSISRPHSSIEAMETTQRGIRNTSRALRTVTRAPLLFRLAKTMIRRRVRGGHRLVGILEQLGMLDEVAHYQLGRGIGFEVPLFRADTCWDQHDVEDYEAQLIHMFCGLVDRLSDVVLFDCGADIGTFSARVCSSASSVARVIAFEPNPDVTVFLKRNLSHLRVPSEAIAKAVSSFNGTGRLEVPDYDSSGVARFLVAGDGPLQVVTIDSMEIRGGNIAIKIDVEGSELEVLKGAAKTISSARQCVIALEAHPQVARRTGCDPVECLRFLKSLRPFEFVVAETGEDPPTSTPLISDGQKAVYNVIGWTR